MLTKHVGPVFCIAYHPKGKSLLSGGEDHKIYKWDPWTGEIFSEYEAEENISALAFAPDGKTFASGDVLGNIYIWNNFSGKKILSLRQKYYITDLAFSYDQKYLLSSSYEKNIYIWRVDTGELEGKLEGHEAEINRICFLPKKKKILSASSDSTSRLWDIEEKKCLYIYEKQNGVISSIACTQKGHLVASSSLEKNVHIWDYEEKKCFYVLEHDEWVMDVEFTKDEKKLVTCCGKDREFGLAKNGIFIWDTRKWELLDEIFPHNDFVSQLVLSPDDTRIASCAYDSTVCISTIKENYLEKSTMTNIQQEEAEEPCVLVIDDDEWILLLIKTILSKYYNLVTACDGEEGLKKAEAIEPSVIIMDVIMPKMDGWTLIKKLRSYPKFAFVPVIFLTALDSVENRALGFRLGADDYLPKPFDGKELLSRVENALERRQQIEKALKHKISTTTEHALHGTLEEIGLASLFMLLQSEQKSGTLTCSYQKQIKQIFFRKGEIIQAKSLDESHLEGEELIFYMLSWPEGKFEFKAIDVDTNRQIEISTTDLLLKIAKRFDEKRKIEN